VQSDTQSDTLRRVPSAKLAIPSVSTFTWSSMSDFFSESETRCNFSKKENSDR
jgi:hypothetical protein